MSTFRNETRNKVCSGPRAPPRSSPAPHRRGSRGGAMGSPAPPLWATRPPDAPTVKSKDDLHNLSQDSGLSHSPTHLHAESPQLTIGQPIRHVDNLHGQPIHRVDSLQPKQGVAPKKDKQTSKWNFGSLFKRRPAGSDGEPGEEDGKTGFLGRKKRGGSKKKLNASVSAPPRSTADVPPPLPPKNTNVFQPTMQVRGGHLGKEAIFPHLKPDLKYPEPGARLENGGYYYDQRFGYVRAGSYYDQQINLMIHPGADVASRSSRESTMSKERCSSGVHSMGQGSIGHSMPSGINDVSSNSSFDIRSWKDQKHVIKKQVEIERNKLKDSSDEDEVSSQSSRAHSLSRLYLGHNGSLASQGRSGSSGSISRRSKAARTDRYLQRRSKEEEVLLRELEDNRQQVESRISAIHGHCQSPYIHTAYPSQTQNGHLNVAHRSQSVDTHIDQEPPERPPLPQSPLATTPPPPPPRDPKKKLYLLSQNGRPVSYSFESINVTPTGMPPRVPTTSTPANHLPIPPRRPLANHFSSSEQHIAIERHAPTSHPNPSSPTVPNASSPSLPRPPSQYPSLPPPHSHQPVRGEVLRTPSSAPRPRSAQAFHDDASSLQNFVDHEPRSRRPITWTDCSGKDSPLFDGDIWREFEDSAAQFWKPHANRLNAQVEESKENTVNLDDSSREDSPLVTSVDCKSPNRDSAIVASPLPIQDSNSCSSIEKSGKSSPSSISSKDSGCSEPPIVKKKLIVNQRNNVTRPLSAVLEKSESFDKESSPKGNTINVIQENNNTINEDNPGFSTKKRRSHFEDALNELEEICNDIAADEDLLDRAERRDLPTIHQELIWRGRESDNNLTEDTSVHNTSGEMAFSDIDNIMNWNTSSSFENLAPGFLTPSRARTPSNRRSGIIDKKLDDMCFRKLMAASKVPTTEANPISRSDQSYLLLSPALSPASSFATSLDNKTTCSEDEPDTRTDDVMFRNIRDKNLNNIEDPQPKFGIPLGLATGAANSDYLHAIPQGRYKSRFNAMRTPDVVMDDVAFRAHRKDGNVTDPDHLGIVKDPNALIIPPTVWPAPTTSGRISPVVFYPNKNDKNMQELSKNIAQIIKKQSSKSSGDLNDIDLNDPEVSDCLKYTMDIIQKEASYPKGRKYMKTPRAKKPARTGPKPDWSGKNLYQLLSNGHVSEPENMHSQVSRDDTDSPDTNKSHNSAMNDKPRSDESMVNVLTGATPTLQDTDRDSSKHEGVMSVSPQPTQHHAMQNMPSTPAVQQHETNANAEQHAMHQREGPQEQQSEEQEVSYNNHHAASTEQETEQENSAANPHELIVQAVILGPQNIDLSHLDSLDSLDSPPYLDSPKKSFSLSSLIQLSPREAESCKNLSDGADQDSFGQNSEEGLNDLIEGDLREEDHNDIAHEKLLDGEPPNSHDKDPIEPSSNEPLKEHNSEPLKPTNSEPVVRTNSDQTSARVPSSRPPSGGSSSRPPSRGSSSRPPSSESKRSVDVLGGLGEGKLSGELDEWLSHPAVLVVCYLLACLHSITGLDLLTAFGVLLTVVSLVSVVLF